jgi:hypothetical protein
LSPLQAGISVDEVELRAGVGVDLHDRQGQRDHHRRVQPTGEPDRDHQDTGEGEAAEDTGLPRWQGHFAWQDANKV